jgi:hypothetical protein
MSRPEFGREAPAGRRPECMFSEFADKIGPCEGGLHYLLTRDGPLIMCSRHFELFLKAVFK